LTKQEGNTAIDLLTKLVALRGENISNYKNLALWVSEFEKDGFTLKDIEKIVDLGKKLPKFNPLSYGDLITAFEENGQTVTGYAEYKTETAFTAGAKFAQRWINANEELPEKEVVVLCKVKNLAWNDCDVMTGYLTDTTLNSRLAVWKIEGRHISHYKEAINNCVTHWRPIEIL